MIETNATLKAAHHKLALSRASILKIIGCFILTTTFALPGYAKVLFEGYYKITLADEPIGYLILKQEVADSDQKFKVTSFLVTNDKGGSMQESVKATSTKDLAPFAFEHASLTKDENDKPVVRAIKAQFSVETPKVKKTASKTKTKLQVAKDAIPSAVKNSESSAKDAENVLIVFDGTIRSNGETKKINKKFKPGIFLSSFLTLMMLQSKAGLATNNRYEYEAIAEEDGELSRGVASVESSKEFNGEKVFVVKNTYKEKSFVNLVNPRGETLLIDSPDQKIKAELVATSTEATQNMPLNNEIIKTVFGDIPAGNENVLAKRAKSKLAPVREE
jgi:hypothetical protein